MDLSQSHMSIAGDVEDINVPENLVELFKAMVAGRTIASVTFDDRSVSPARPTELKDFTAEQYIPKGGLTGAGEWEDYVVVEAGKQGFSMNTVTDFTL